MCWIERAGCFRKTARMSLHFVIDSTDGRPRWNSELRKESPGNSNSRKQRERRKKGLENKNTVESLAGAISPLIW